jgi:hypothetical protein
MDVRGWLQGLGLEQYGTLFRANGIDAEVLLELTEIDLEKLGVPLGNPAELIALGTRPGRMCSTTSKVLQCDPVSLDDRIPQPC